MNSGVEIVLARMATHPEEFYGDSDKWKFIYKEYFRDAMTETEKGAIFDRIKEIRKEEFTLHVMKTMTTEEPKEDNAEWASSKGVFGSASIKRENSKVGY
jgi:hypothetical protein